MNTNFPRLRPSHGIGTPTRVFGTWVYRMFLFTAASSGIVGFKNSL